MQFRDKPIIEGSFDGYNDRDPYQLVPKGYLTIANNVFLSDNKVSKVFGSSPIAPAISNGSFNGLGALNFLWSRRPWPRAGARRCGGRRCPAPRPGQPRA